jgi:cytochrome b561
MLRIEPFAATSRVLHWLMAAAVLAMLFIGVSMVGSLTHYHALLALHRPLGALVFVLVIVRFVNRLTKPPPAFLATMSPRERSIVTVSEWLMYALMFVLPLVGWAVVSAARYPVVLYGPIHLPPILPKNAALYTVLLQTHQVLAFLLLATIAAHLAGVLFHTLVVRDGLLRRMASLTRRR